MRTTLYAIHSIIAFKELYKEENKMKRTKRLLALLLAVMTAVMMTGCLNAKKNKYEDLDNWVFFADGKENEADVFVVAPTVDKGEDGRTNADINDDNYRSRLVSGLNTQKTLYNSLCTVYAPYYSQATFYDYFNMTAEERQPYIENAYADVKEAFEYYLKISKDKPIILFGYSQGGEMIVRLLEDFFVKGKNKNRLVAAYAIGYCLTDEELKANPGLKLAESADDTGVIISYEVESEGVTESVIVPKGMKMNSINPLTWSRDNEFADKTLNKGACFMDKEGNISSEIPNITGAYIDENRGTLIATDIVPSDYSNKYFPDGVLHLNDLYFFYRNLQENIKTRLEAFNSK